MSTVSQPSPRQVLQPHLGNWQAIDWAMKAISMASHLCFVAGLVDLSDRLLEIHGEAQARRDRA